MKRAIAAFLFGVFVSTAVNAKDIAVTFSDNDQQSFALVHMLFEQCISGAVLRGDAGQCRNIAAWLDIVSGKVKTAADAAIKEPAAPAEPPK